ncbi:50S ribosomal protein L4, partial [Candidatus Dojkabacteria bacterium]|nr:50S ribosomal protein L4 [Candidatus Dojkabacteria bacterium]
MINTVKVDIANKKDSKVDLKSKVWDVEFNEDLVTQAINIYLFNQRKGTAHSKTRAEVSGGGRKPWKQKGTGRARHGSIRSPIWVKGGVAFGPRSESNWKRSLNKKMNTKAICGLLSEIRRNDSLVIVKFPSSKEIKTIRNK